MAQNPAKPTETSWGLPMVIGGILLVGAAAGNMFAGRRMLKQTAARSERHVLRKQNMMKTKLKYDKNKQVLSYVPPKVPSVEIIDQDMADGKFDAENIQKYLGTENTYNQINVEEDDGKLDGKFEDLPKYILGSLPKQEDKTNT